MSNEPNPPVPSVPAPKAQNENDKDGWPPNRILSFVAGFIFLLIMVGIAWSKPDLQHNYIILVVLSATAAAFAAVIPGMFSFEIANSVKATGAMAVFAAVFFGAPRIVTPTGPEARSYRTSPAGGETFAWMAEQIAHDFGVAPVFESSCPLELQQMKLKPDSPIRALDAGRGIENLLNIRADGGVVQIKSIKAEVDSDNAKVTVSCA